MQKKSQYSLHVKIKNTYFVIFHLFGALIHSALNATVTLSEQQQRSAAMLLALEIAAKGIKGERGTIEIKQSNSLQIKNKKRK